MNFQRIYEYRFKDVDMSKKNLVWREVADFVSAMTNQPQTVLDPAGGMCEFINNIQAKEKWTIDLNEEFVSKYADKSIKIIVGENLSVDLPENYFDLIFVSNFLEHLHSQDKVAEFLSKMFEAVKPGGFVVVMGPNFKYAWKEYFDFADHTVTLSELGAAEHIVGAGFDIVKIFPKFLPLSFRGRLPVNKLLVKTYLKIPFFWSFFGKQFLIVGRK